MQDINNKLAALLEALTDLVKTHKEVLAVLKTIEANTRK